MKKILFFLVFSLVLLSPFLSIAGESLVTCGQGDTMCELKDLIKIPMQIVDFLIKYIVTGLATLFIIIGGLTILFSGGNPGTASLGKKILFTAVVGLALALGAKALINYILQTIGARIPGV